MSFKNRNYCIGPSATKMPEVKVLQDENFLLPVFEHGFTIDAGEDFEENKENIYDLSEIIKFIQLLKKHNQKLRALQKEIEHTEKNIFEILTYLVLKNTQKELLSQADKDTISDLSFKTGITHKIANEAIHYLEKKILVSEKVLHIIKKIEETISDRQKEQLTALHDVLKNEKDTLIETQGKLNKIYHAINTEITPQIRTNHDLKPLPLRIDFSPDKKEYAKINRSADLYNKDEFEKVKSSAGLISTINASTILYNSTENEHEKDIEFENLTKYHITAFENMYTQHLECGLNQKLEIEVHSEYTMQILIAAAKAIGIPAKQLQFFLLDNNDIPEIIFPEYVEKLYTSMSNYTGENTELTELYNSFKKIGKKYKLSNNEHYLLYLRELRSNSKTLRKKHGDSQSLGGYQQFMSGENFFPVIEETGKQIEKQFTERQADFKP